MKYSRTLHHHTSTQSKEIVAITKVPSSIAILPAAPVKEVKSTVELPLLPEDPEDAEVGLAEFAVEGTYPCIDAMIAPKIDASAPCACVGLGSACVLPPITMTFEPTETAMPEIVV